MMINVITTTNAYGKYVLRSPFIIDDNDYKCTSVHTIASLVDNGENIYELIYAPKSIDLQTYTSDRDSGVAIANLVSANGTTIRVPTSYIISAPTNISVNYSRRAISLDLGILPDELDLSGLCEDLALTAIEVIGKTGVTKEHVIPIRKIVSLTEHNLLETDRLYQLSLRKSPRHQIGNLTTYVTNNLTQIRLLEEEIIRLRHLLNLS